MRRIIRKMIIWILKVKGYSSYSSMKIVKILNEDFFSNSTIRLKDKIWALKKGFFPSSISFYGLTKENYRLYLNDFDYYYMHPLNGKFAMWIDDKLTMRYVLYKYSEYMPKYYYLITNDSKLNSLLDLDGNYNESYEDMILLLRNIGKLALKPVSGTSGIGFSKLSFYDNSYYLNYELIKEEELIEFVKSKNYYIITEYLDMHDDISKLNSSAVNTIRMTLIKVDGLPLIANSYIRVSRKGAIVDNTFVGSVVSKVDIESGEYSSLTYMWRDGAINVDVHPDTNKAIVGKVPNWKFTKEKLLNIFDSMLDVEYVGFDIAITKDGFKIIEINSHQGLDSMQCHTPIFNDEILGKFFKEKLLRYRR